GTRQAQSRPRQAQPGHLRPEARCGEARQARCGHSHPLTFAANPAKPVPFPARDGFLLSIYDLRAHRTSGRPASYRLLARHNRSHQNSAHLSRFGLVRTVRLVGALPRLVAFVAHFPLRRFRLVSQMKLGDGLTCLAALWIGLSCRKAPDPTTPTAESAPGP